MTRKTTKIIAEPDAISEIGRAPLPVKKASTCVRMQDRQGSTENNKSHRGAWIMDKTRLSIVSRKGEGVEDGSRRFLTDVATNPGAINRSKTRIASRLRHADAIVLVWMVASMGILARW